ncbi:MAG: hypothetical protein IT385_19275 [Deltaproteobacteria bacterium]|nr:hypothetical protein [Deltaproteobacteria bacterium]
MEGVTGRFQPELAELVARAVGAVWPLCARGSPSSPDEPRGFTVVEEAEALAPLSEPERLLALVILGPAASVGVEATLDHAVQRLSSVGAGGALLHAVLQGGQRDAPTLERLWSDVERSHGDRRFTAAAAFALAGALPLAVDGLEPIDKIEDPDVASLVCFAVGHAARRGDPGARALVRDALARPTPVDRGRDAAMLKGLGGGFLEQGTALVATWTRRTLQDVVLWGRVTRRAALTAIALGASSPTVRRAVEIGLAASDDRAEALDFLSRLPSDVSHALLDASVGAAPSDGALGRWPSAVRSAFVATWLAADVELPSAVVEHLQRERATPVVLTVLERLALDPERLPLEARQHLARAWADHPDVAVQRAIASAGAFFRPRPHLHLEVHDATADIVALPASVLARDDLDRLRVALWSGDSDRIVELATHVPLDRRQSAREALLGALEIPNAALRRAIVEAVGRIGGHADGVRLLDAARRYRALEGTVAAALRELNTRGLAESLAEVFQRRLKWADDDAVDDYCAIAGPEQVMHLLSALETRYDPAARSGAARAIARRKAHEVVFALRAAGLSDAQEASRLAALGALHDLTGTSPSADELAGHALLFRPADELPEAIERAREAGLAALPGVRRTLARGSWKRRRAACDVLAMLPAGAWDEASQVLVEVLADPDEDVRLAAMEALVQRGFEARTPRERTLVALAARRAKELLEPGAEADVPTLLQALRLGGYVFRSEVLEVLERLAVAGRAGELSEHEALLDVARLDVAHALLRPGGIEATLRAVDHTWQAVPHRARYVRGLAEADVGGLVHEIEAGTWGWRAREAACQALVRPAPALAPEERAIAIRLLQGQISEDDDDVRRSVFQGLAWLGGEDAARAIATGFQSPFQEDRDVVALALGAVGENALPVIDALVHEPWWESRQGAALALSHWREGIQIAVDRLIVLAVDAEYRVSQAARDGLLRHGLIPSGAAIVDAIGRAQSLTIEGLEPWLLLQLQHGSPEVAMRLDALVEDAPIDLLPQRIGLVATFRAEHLALWLEDVAHGRTTRHIGVRLAAADALRALTRRACPVCRGERSVRCPGCNGGGEVPCPTCSGRGLVLVPCPDPDCTARLATRPIGSKRCVTCRGRGEVSEPCGCQRARVSEVVRVRDDGVLRALEAATPVRARVPCDVCAGAGRLACQACDGTGADASPAPDPGAPPGLSESAPRNA